MEDSASQMEGGATYWSEYLVSRGLSGSVLMDHVSDVSLDDVVVWAQSNRPTIAQSNGALRDLQNLFMAKNKSINVSESANAAAFTLGLPNEFSRLRMDKIPELRGVVAAKSMENEVVAQMMGVVQTETTLPPVPLDTAELQGAVEAVAALMQSATPSNAAGAPPPTLSNLAMAGPEGLQEQLVNAVRAPDRQALLWLLVVSIPLLLQSYVSEARVLGLFLLTFFFALMTNNMELVFEIRGVLLSLQRKR